MYPLWLNIEKLDNFEVVDSFRFLVLCKQAKPNPPKKKQTNKPNTKKETKLITKQANNLHCSKKKPQFTTATTTIVTNQKQKVFMHM